MGSMIQKMVQAMAAKRDVRVLTVGLDASGKTTMLYKMKLGEIVTTIPTIGFNVETVEYKRINFTVWDLGGRDKARALHRHYYQNTQAVIFCVDSNDRDRVDEAARELSKMLADDELVGVPFLVFANKQDLPNALSTTEVMERLPLHQLRDIQGSSFPSGDGIYEGLEWLSQAVSGNVVAEVSRAVSQKESPSTGFFSKLFSWTAQATEIEAPAEQAVGN